MKPYTLNPPFTAVFRKETAAIAQFYNIPLHLMQQALKPIATSFENYWEMVFAPNNFEIITAGTGPAFATQIKQVALQQGISEQTALLFEKCYLAFPKVACGLKLAFSPFGALEPTLYVRTKTRIAATLHFLSHNLPASEVNLLQQALADNQILYGLGFSQKQGELYLKTYTINPVKTATGAATVGFVSHRLFQQQISREHKIYLPNVSLYAFAPEELRLQLLQRFLVQEMNYTIAGHIGLHYQAEKLMDTKIYIERVGSIPTDFSAR